MCIERCKHGSGRGLRRPAAEMRQGGAFLLYSHRKGKDSRQGICLGGSLCSCLENALRQQRAVGDKGRLLGALRHLPHVPLLLRMARLPLLLRVRRVLLAVLPQWRPHGGVVGGLPDELLSQGNAGPVLKGGAGRQIRVEKSPKSMGSALLGSAAPTVPKSAFCSAQPPNARASAAARKRMPVFMLRHLLGL